MTTIDPDVTISRSVLLFLVERGANACGLEYCDTCNQFATKDDEEMASYCDDCGDGLYDGEPLPDLEETKIVEVSRAINKALKIESSTSVAERAGKSIGSAIEAYEDQGFIAPSVGRSPKDKPYFIESLQGWKYSHVIFASSYEHRVDDYLSLVEGELRNLGGAPRWILFDQFSCNGNSSRFTEAYFNGQVFEYNSFQKIPPNAGAPIKFCNDFLRSHPNILQNSVATLEDPDESEIDP